jgi:hypothetical protein
MGWLFLSALFDFENPLLAEMDFFKRTLERTDSIFQDGSFLDLVAFCSIGLGLAVGFCQTLPETLMGTAAFFAHVVRSRRRVLAAKLLVGVGLLAVTVALPPAILAAALGGSDRLEAPQGWSEMQLTVLSLASGLVAYLGAVAVGSRGLPWNEWASMAAGLFVLWAAVGSTLARWDLFAGSVVLAVAALLTAAWAVSGTAAREFGS